MKWTFEQSPVTRDESFSHRRNNAAVTVWPLLTTHRGKQQHGCTCLKPKALYDILYFTPQSPVRSPCWNLTSWLITREFSERPKIQENFKSTYKSYNRSNVVRELEQLQQTSLPKVNSMFDRTFKALVAAGMRLNFWVLIGKTHLVGSNSSLFINHHQDLLPPRSPADLAKYFPLAEFQRTWNPQLYCCLIS